MTKTKLIPVTQWGKYHSWPPIGGLRHLIFFADVNGFDKVIKRVGRRVLIDEAAFFHWAGKNESTIEPKTKKEDRKILHVDGYVIPLPKKQITIQERRYMKANPIYEGRVPDKFIGDFCITVANSETYTKGAKCIAHWGPDKTLIIRRDRRKTS